MFVVAADALSELVRVILFVLVQGRHLPHKKFYGLPQKKRAGQIVLSTAAVSQVPSARHSQYAKWAYLGMACSGFLHRQGHT